MPTLLVPCLLFGSPPPLRHVSTAHRSLPLRGCAVKPGEDPELLAKVDFDRQRALLSERAAAYQSLPVVSTLVLGFSCNQLTAFAESDPNTLALLAADAAVALVLLAMASASSGDGRVRARVLLHQAAVRHRDAQSQKHRWRRPVRDAPRRLGRV